MSGIGKQSGLWELSQIETEIWSDWRKGKKTTPPPQYLVMEQMKDNPGIMLLHIYAFKYVCMPEQRRALWVAKEQNVFANHILDHYPKFGLKELNDTGINWIIACCKRAKLF